MDLEFSKPISCYNGCFDDATQRILNNQVLALELIRTKEPEAHVTYFPMEEEYVVHVWGKEISKYHKTIGSALKDAMMKLGVEP